VQIVNFFLIKINVRTDDTQCGGDAIFFKQNYFKFITVPYYFLVDNSFLLLLSSILFVWFIHY
jgi:hypothetical protein